MNQTSVYPQSLPETKLESGSRRVLAIVLISIVSLALITLTVASVFQATQAKIQEAEGATSISVNPELFASSRYQRVFSQSTNPELMVVYRHATMAREPKAQSWVINPELNAANRYAETRAEAGAVVSRIANPELMVAGRYAIARITDPAFLAANPEVMAHLRFSAGK